ncbi:MFS transporter [Nitrogeniibacter mangrovi]|uniref:MFS transporter n=2 Tax=Nitrogeniibacter mangrovi TaxID=2016596 RepID=A0A6C1B959_9RHOO|nr:MFS transporter [Nitrogeniibacter mangrovi]
MILLAAAMMAISMGGRQSLGLFVSPINTSTGMGITAISLALAIAQLVWGLVQPLSGAVADRYGAGRALATGVLLLAAGAALTPLVSTGLGLSLTLGVLFAAGSGASSMAVLMGATVARLPAHRRGMASGIINAGGSFGQFVFAPVLQGFIALMGWMGAMYALAALMLLGLPVARALKTPAKRRAQVVDDDAAPPDRGMRAALRDAFADRSYLLLHAGFFTCGFHIAFLVTHLPGEIGLCGLPASVASWTLAIIGLANIFGSLYAGWCVQRYRSKHVLAWMYASRAVLIAVYLMAPKSELTFYLFAAGLGFTWLATVPPTAGLVGKLFGSRYLSTLFGLTIFTHQIGGFLGAWLGGIAVTAFGDYQWMWYADIALAAMAALANLPIREARVSRLPQPA